MKSRSNYWQRVKQHAKALKGDGCTKSPDFFYRRCCDEHDIVYRTGMTTNGIYMTRLEADNAMFKCMQRRGKIPILGTYIIPAVYWSMVRLFGSGAWKANKAVGE